MTNPELDGTDDSVPLMLARKTQTPLVDTHQRTTQNPAGPPTVSTPANPPASDVLETQPVTAAGYEWSERYATLSHRNHDGYAALMVKPDGQGYFGWSLPSPETIV